MPGIDYLAQKCLDDAKTAVQSIAQAQGKTVFHLYDADQLLDETVGIKYPAIGIVYEGIRHIERTPRDTHRVGAEAELWMTFVLMTKDESLGATSQTRLNAITFLDDLRKAMKDRRSPSGHFWRFMLEAPAARKNGNIMWVQRWVTPTILTA